MTNEKDSDEFERAFIREWGLPTDKSAPDDCEQMKEAFLAGAKHALANLRLPERKVHNIKNELIYDYGFNNCLEIIIELNGIGES